jgi:hypothetical protein
MILVAGATAVVGGQISGRVVSARLGAALL